MSQRTLKSDLQSLRDGLGDDLFDFLALCAFGVTLLLLAVVIHG